MQPNMHRTRPEERGADREEGPSIWAYANIVLRRRRLLLVVPAIGAAVALAYSLLAPRDYTARASFLPMESSSRGSMAGLAGLAAQFGVSQLGALGGGGSMGSAQFYADLLAARELELAAIRTVYDARTPSDSFRGTLIDYFELRGEDPVRAEVKALKKLNRKVLSVSFDRLTSIVRVEVSTRNPQLSALVARRLIELTNEFNMRRRTAQNTAEREFVQQQSAEAAGALRREEDALTAFQAANRNVLAPPLAAELRRRERAVDLARQVYVTLMQQQAMTRMEAVRSTPLIAVIDNPESLVEPERRLHWAYALSGYVGGVLLVFAFALLAESIARARRRHAEEYEEFRRLRSLR